MGICIKEKEFNSAIHKKLSGPYDSEGECLGGCSGSSSSSALAPLANGNFNLPASTMGQCVGGTGGDSRQRWAAAPPWYVSNNCTTYSFHYCNPELPDDRFVGFHWATNLCHVGQAVATTPGQNYTLSFDMGVQPGYTGVYDRHVEVAVFDMSSSQLESWLTDVGISPPAESDINPSVNILYRGNFTIPGKTISNTYESLGWMRMSLQFTATSANTLIMFRPMDTRIGSPSNETANFVIDNVEMA